jgi:PilZ domain
MTTVDRAHPRVASNATVVVKLESESQKGETTNISRGGLCAQLERPIKVGSTAELEISLVFEEGSTSEALVVAARIVWCTHLDMGYQVGLSFLPMSSDQHKYLAIFTRLLADRPREAPAARRSPTGFE